MAQALIALAFFLAAGCLERGSQEAADPSQTLESFTMVQSEAGSDLWRLSAPVGSFTRSGDARLTRPEIRFYRDGRHASTARSRAASVGGDADSVRLEGDVVIVGHEEGTVLKTSRLDYSRELRRFHTEAAVVVESPGAVMRGRGLSADAALSDITVFEQETIFQ